MAFFLRQALKFFVSLHFLKAQCACSFHHQVDPEHGSFSSIHRKHSPLELSAGAAADVQFAAAAKFQHNPLRKKTREGKLGAAIANESSSRIGIRS